MPDFRLELAVPDPIPEGRAAFTFYWSSNASGSFESTYGPYLNQSQGGMCISGVLRVGVGVAGQGAGP